MRIVPFFLFLSITMKIQVSETTQSLLQIAQSMYNQPNELYELATTNIEEGDVKAFNEVYDNLFPPHFKNMDAILKQISNHILRNIEKSIEDKQDEILL